MTAPLQRRSWYLPADITDRLAAVVDDIHHATHCPRHKVIAATLSVAIEHQADNVARPAGEPA